MAAAFVVAGAWAREAPATTATEHEAAAATRAAAATAVDPAAASGRQPVTAARPHPDAPDRSWPVAAAQGALRPLVIRDWDPPATSWGAGHRGVDLATGPGSPVYAAAAGRVVFTGMVAGRGVVSIELAGSAKGDGNSDRDSDRDGPPLRTTFEPVRASVAKGDRVRAGDVVGTVQQGPFHCRQACLHWGLLRGDRYLDPLSLLPPWMLRNAPSRLLPFLGLPVPEEQPEEQEEQDGRDRGRAAQAGPASPGTEAAARREPVRAQLPVVPAGTAVALAVVTAWAHHRLRGPEGRAHSGAVISREPRAVPSTRRPP